MIDEKQTAKERQRERMRRWREANREHIKSYQKAWREQNAASVAEYQKEYGKQYREREGVQESNRVRNLWKNYRMTADEFNELWASQDGKCAICEIDLAPKGRTPNSVAVDHNHENGAVRGLLCRTCNVGIGYLNDDPDLLIAAAEYLISRGFYAYTTDKG